MPYGFSGALLVARRGAVLLNEGYGLMSNRYLLILMVLVIATASTLYHLSDTGGSFPLISITIGIATSLSATLIIRLLSFAGYWYKRRREEEQKRPLEQREP